VLAQLGYLFTSTDDAVAYQHYMESYRYFPANLSVVAWLGSYYVKSEAFEKAIPFFERLFFILFIFHVLPFFKLFPLFQQS